MQESGAWGQIILPTICHVDLKVGKTGSDQVLRQCSLCVVYPLHVEVIDLRLLSGTIIVVRIEFVSYKTRGADLVSFS